MGYNKVALPQGRTASQRFQDWGVKSSYYGQRRYVNPFPASRVPTLGWALATAGDSG